MHKVPQLMFLKIGKYLTEYLRQNKSKQKPGLWLFQMSLPSPSKSQATRVLGPSGCYGNKTPTSPLPTSGTVAGMTSLEQRYRYPSWSQSSNRSPWHWHPPLRCRRGVRVRRSAPTWDEVWLWGWGPEVLHHSGHLSGAAPTSWRWGNCTSTEGWTNNLKTLWIPDWR